MAVRDKIAGKVVADRDKTAGEAEAIHDKIAEEAADDNTVDPYIELAVLEAVDRIDEEADEDIAAEADKAVELVDLEVVTEPFIENLEDPEGAKVAKSITKSFSNCWRCQYNYRSCIRSYGRRSHYT